MSLLGGLEPKELFQVAQKHSRKHTQCTAFLKNIVANKINHKRYKYTRVPSKMNI